MKKSLILSLIIVLILYITFSLFVLYKSVKIAQAALTEVQSIPGEISRKNYENIFFTIGSVKSKFNTANYWSKYAFWLKAVPVINNDYNTYQYSLEAANSTFKIIDKIRWELVKEGVIVGFSAESMDFSGLTTIISDNSEDISEIANKLKKAYEKAEKININKYPVRYQEDINQLKSILKTAESYVDQYYPLTQNIDYILGSEDEHRILMILQNSHELRPTGGFIGTIGEINIFQGKLTKYEVRDVYGYDRLVIGKEKYKAPKPITDYTNVENWYLRDANWSPDFPVSAQNMKMLYEYESKNQDTDTVIAINPYLIEDILRLTGDITIHELTFTPDNFIETLQDRVERDYWKLGIEKDDRKVIMNDLALVFLQRVLKMEMPEILQLNQIFVDALDRKDILVYTKNPDLEEYVQQNNWGGQVVQTEDDYLFVVDSNLGALKTDRVVHRTQDYSIEESENGDFKAHLILTYENTGNFDYKTTRYRTYTRVYVPLNSKLIYSGGFMSNDKVNDNTPALNYNDLGYTVFAGFISVEPQQTHQVVIDYKLPESISKKLHQQDKYHLYWQKQPGTRNFDLVFRIKTKDDLFSFSPAAIDYNLISPNVIEVKLNNSLEDREFTVSVK